MNDVTSPPPEGPADALPAAQGSPDPTTEQEQEQEQATRRYLDLIRSVHDEWDTLERSGSSPMQLSSAALATVKEAVRADSRHGSQVTMPPTPAGPFTVSELTLRTVVRRAVDTVPDARSLRTSAQHAPGDGPGRTRGRPTLLRCRISVHRGGSSLPTVAHEVRTAVLAACRAELGLSPLLVDVHIEDLHEH